MKFVVRTEFKNYSHEEFDTLAEAEACAADNRAEGHTVEILAPVAAPVKRGRGRPPKAKMAQPAKRRGRPPLPKK